MQICKIYNCFLQVFIFWNRFMIVLLSILQATSLSMYTTKQSSIHWIFQCIQPSNHLSIGCKTNNRIKFNFIGIKKTKGVPKNFLKGRQINFFKLLYIIFFFNSGWSQGPSWPWGSVTPVDWIRFWKFPSNLVSFFFFFFFFCK